MLYFTIIGDNGITRFYYLANCLSKTFIAVLIIISAIMGIVGAQIYQKLLIKRTKNVLKSTKIASFMHWPTLIVAVLGIMPFIPGSLFEPTRSLNDKEISTTIYCQEKHPIDRFLSIIFENDKK